MVKVYARVLCSDIEYKTLCIDGTTSAQQVIMILLQKFKMKHRDPNLYYLTMEVWMRSTGEYFSSYFDSTNATFDTELQLYNQPRKYG